jgi:hypothetical protein
MQDIQDIDITQHYTPALNMLDRFDYWKYSDNSNCWDFVVCFLSDRCGIDLPKFGICPQDKKGMTKASGPVIDSHLIECDPIQNAIACHYHGRLLVHVGVIDNGVVRHAHQKTGVRRDTIKRFESLAQKTVYRIPKCLL